MPDCRAERHRMCLAWLMLASMLVPGRAASDEQPMIRSFRGSQMEVQSHGDSGSRRGLINSQIPKCEYSSKRVDIEIPECTVDSCYGYKTIGYAQVACALLIYNEGPAACKGIAVLFKRGSARTYQLRKGAVRTRAPNPSVKTFSWTVTSCPGVDIPKAEVSTTTPTTTLAPTQAPEPIESDRLPVIAICAGTTSNKQHFSDNDFSTLALFRILLPSLAKTFEPGFQYKVYIAYDKHDRFYDNAAHRQAIHRWFRAHVSHYGNNAALTTELHLVVNYGERKPGPAFNVATKAAYEDGADYFFRVNDDSEVRTRFAAKSVAALASMCPPNIGAVGPTCREGNTYILTHDFTHRTHMDIFKGVYYPVELVDWWMDDWITHVYGDRNTFRLPEVVVKHHVSYAGQRYSVDHSHARLVAPLEKAGHAAILAHVKQMGALPCEPEFGPVSTKLRQYSAAVVQQIKTNAKCSKHLKILHGVALTTTDKLTYFAKVTVKSKSQCCSKCSGSTQNKCAAFSFSAVSYSCELYDESVRGMTRSNVRVDPKAVVGITKPHTITDRAAASVFIPPSRGKASEENKVIKISFGPKNIAGYLPKGYTAADGSRFTTHSLLSTSIGFGWRCEVTKSARARDISSVQTRAQAMRSHIVLSTLIIMDRHDHCHGADWEIALGEGAYSVVVGYSDPTEAPSTSGCRLQGMVAEGSPKLNAEHENKSNNYEFAAVVHLHARQRLGFSGRYNDQTNPCSSISYMLLKPLGKGLPTS